MKKILITAIFASQTLLADRIYPEPKAKKNAYIYMSHVAELAKELKSLVDDLEPKVKAHVEKLGNNSSAKIALRDVQEMQSACAEFSNYVGMGIPNPQMSITKLNDLYDAWTNSIKTYGDVKPTPNLVQEGFAVSAAMQKILDYYQYYIIER